MNRFLTAILALVCASSLCAPAFGQAGSKKPNPFQQGSSLNAAGINYNSLQAMQAMKRLKELESLSAPTN